MPTNFIENPELNKLYLIKRNKSGDPSKRFQPATIVEIKKINNGLTSVARVHWLFDEEFEDDVLMFYGFAKDLTRKWVDAEAARKDREITALQMAIHQLHQLRFDPAHMSKITS